MAKAKQRASALPKAEQRASPLPPARDRLSPRGRVSPRDRVSPGGRVTARERVLWSLSLLGRGIRWRLGTSAAFFVVALIAIGAAAAGPVYLLASSDAMLHQVLRAAPVQDSGVALGQGSNLNDLPVSLPSLLPSAGGQLPG